MTADELMAEWRKSRVRLDFARDRVAECKADVDGLKSAVGVGSGSSFSAANNDGGNAMRLAIADSAVERWRMRARQREQVCERVDDLVKRSLDTASGYHDVERAARGYRALSLKYRDGVTDVRAAAVMGVTVRQFRRIVEAALFDIGSK